MILSFSEAAPAEHFPSYRVVRLTPVGEVLQARATSILRQAEKDVRLHALDRCALADVDDLQVRRGLAAGAA